MESKWVDRAIIFSGFFVLPAIYLKLEQIYQILAFQYNRRHISNNF